MCCCHVIVTKFNYKGNQFNVRLNKKDVVLYAEYFFFLEYWISILGNQYTK